MACGRAVLHLAVCSHDVMLSLLLLFGRRGRVLLDLFSLLAAFDEGKRVLRHEDALDVGVSLLLSYFADAIWVDAK